MPDSAHTTPAEAAGESGEVRWQLIFQVWMALPETTISWPAKRRMDKREAPPQ
jgi:hypothetical protein